MAVRSYRSTLALFLAVLALLLLPGASSGESDAPSGEEGAGRLLYVSIHGSDDTGDGSEHSPWRTPNIAASNACYGDTILIGEGVYEIETPIELPPGVNIRGMGESTVLTSSVLTEELGGLNALLRLVSPTGDRGEKADGSQQVSHIKFDGMGTATQAIEIQNRCDVSVHDCVIVNFVHVGVGWRATDTGDGTPPEEYVTAGRFYNNYMKDNSFYGPDAWGAIYGRGALFCGGLKDFEIYGNTIIEDCRTGQEGKRGVPVKFWYYTGWMLGCKIHGNVIARLGSPTFSHDGAGWAFAIESAYHAGMEIYENDLIGAIDLNGSYCGTYGGTSYDYATRIHDNRFTADPNPKSAYRDADFEETAFILEWRTERTLIERNTVSGYNQAVYFNLREGVYDFTFRDNLCTELGGEAGSMFRMDGIGSDMKVENFTVTDNVFEGRPSQMNGFGIILGQEMGTWSGRDISIIGNAVGNTYWNWLAADNYTHIDHMTVKDNMFFSVGGECMIRSEGDIDGYLYADNEETDSESFRSRCRELQARLDAEQD